VQNRAKKGESYRASVSLTEDGSFHTRQAMEIEAKNHPTSREGITSIFRGYQRILSCRSQINNFDCVCRPFNRIEDLSRNLTAIHHGCCPHNRGVLWPHSTNSF
jgi:hypothetical protein